MRRVGGGVGGEPWLQSCRPVAVAGLWGAYSVCACLRALSVLHGAGGDGDGERGQPELAAWVMNLLLRHSLWRNYTHQSQEGLSRPLISS